MNRYEFRGTVYYSGAPGRPKEKMITTIVVDAPSPEVAQAVLDNYGMEAMRPVPPKTAG
jgi:hypothetical protein